MNKAKTLNLTNTITEYKQQQQQQNHWKGSSYSNRQNKDQQT